MSKLDAGAMSLPKDEPLNLSAINTGAGIDTPAVDVVSNADQIALEAFMNEKVVVRLADTTDENAVGAVPVTVNGVTQWLFRGVSQEIRRCYLEVLARARTTTWRQGEAVNGQPESARPVPKTAMSYPFNVERDTPKGITWLREILQQRA